MKLYEILSINGLPKGWSRSSYYRLRSACSRAKKLNDISSEVNDQNIDIVLNAVNLGIKYKNNAPKHDNRTHKTYIAEIKRYYKYKSKSNKK